MSAGRAEPLPGAAGRFISTFAGVGGFDIPLEALGFRCVAQVEIADFPVRVLEKRWKDVRRHGDIRTFVGERGSADLVSGGVPCQDWSVAGKRAGLAGGRSGLFFEFARVVDEVAPRVVVFENVPGLLSACSCGDCGRYRAQQLLVDVGADVSEERTAAGVLPGHRGSDFAIVLRELTGFWPVPPKDGWSTGGVCTGDKRTAAWRVLDSRNFGVPQRRRRLFLVASPGAEHALSILFDAEGGQGDPAAGGEAREDAAAAFGERTAGTLNDRRIQRSHSELDGHGAYVAAGEPVPDEQESFRMRGFGDYEGDGAASALKKRDHKDATDLVVAPTLTSPQTNAAARDGKRQDGSRRDRHPIVLADDVAGTVRSHVRPGSNDIGGVVASTPSSEGDVSPPFRTHYGKDWNDPSNPSGPLIVGQEQPEVAPTVGTHVRPGNEGNDAGVIADAVTGDPYSDRPGEEGKLVVAPEVAAPLTHGSFDRSHTPGRRREDDENLVVDPVTFKAGYYTAERRTGGMAKDDEAPALTSQARGGTAEPLVTYSIRSDATRDGEAKTPSPDAEGRVRKRDPGMGVYEEIAPTVDAGQAHIVGISASDGGDVANALRSSDGHDSEDGTGRQPALVIRTVGDYDDPDIKVEEDGLPMLAANPMSDRVMAIMEPEKPLSMYGHSGLEQRVQEDISPPITRGSTLDGMANPPIVLTDQRGREQGERAIEDETFPLHAAKGPSEQQIVSIQDARDIDKDQNGVGASESGEAYTVDTTGAQGVMTGPEIFEPRVARNGRGAPETVSQPLKAQSGRTGKGDSAPMVLDDVAQPVRTNPYNNSDPGMEARMHVLTDAVSVSENERAEVRETPHARQLVTGGGKPGSGYAAARIGSAVRRLTPTETERLQAFPDGWTCMEVDFVDGVGRFPDGEPYSTARCKCPDGPRYAAMGNAVTTNVVRWVVERVASTL